MNKIITSIYNHYSQHVVGSAAVLGRKIKHRDNGIFDILYVGAIDAQKRVLDILEAVNRVKTKIGRYSLLFIGNGSLSQKAEEYALANQINFRIVSRVEDKDLYRAYDGADLFVYVPENQPWGIAPLEAIMAGIPTILSDECGILDYSVVRNSAIVVSTLSVEQISRAIVSIYNSPISRSAFTEKTDVIQEFSWHNLASKTMRIIKSEIV